MSETAASPDLRTGQIRQLVLATWAFAISFWAWNLIGPLGRYYTEQFHLATNQKALLIALPVLVGSLGRIPAGALTDRFGGRVMFTALLVASIPPVLLVMIAGDAGSWPLLLAAAFLLGIAGTTFAVGIPFVSRWFIPARKGFATGIFGAGMGGTALSSFFTPRFVGWFGYTQTHLIIVAALAATAVLCWVMMTNSPTFEPSTDSVIPKLVAAIKLPVTWQLSFLYAVTFGGFVAFSTYLPTYLNDVYSFDLKQAGTRTAGFAIAAVVARPIGGLLSDRVHPKPVVLTSLIGAAFMALVIATVPSAELAAGVSFVVMAFFLGIGTGGVFTWVALRAPSARVGSVAGIVGAAGGLGGFFPPLVLGATYNELTHRYTTGLILLCITATLAALFVAIKLGREESAKGPVSGGIRGKQVDS